MVVIGHPGVPEDLDKGQVRVDLLCPAGRTAHPWPRYRDPPVLHPRYEDTPGVRNIVSPGGAVHESPQCREVCLDLSDNTSQASLSKVVNVGKLRVSVPGHGGDVDVEVHAAFLKIGSWKIL